MRDTPTRPRTSVRLAVGYLPLWAGMVVWLLAEMDLVGPVVVGGVMFGATGISVVVMEALWSRPPSSHRRPTPRR